MHEYEPITHAGIKTLGNRSLPSLFGPGISLCPLAHRFYLNSILYLQSCSGRHKYTLHSPPLSLSLSLSLFFSSFFWSLRASRENFLGFARDAALSLSRSLGQQCMGKQQVTSHHPFGPWPFGMGSLPAAHLTANSELRCLLLMTAGVFMYPRFYFHSCPRIASGEGCV